MTLLKLLVGWINIQGRHRYHVLCPVIKYSFQNNIKINLANEQIIWTLIFFNSSWLRRFSDEYLIKKLYSNCLLIKIFTMFWKIHYESWRDTKFALVNVTQYFHIITHLNLLKVCISECFLVLVFKEVDPRWFNISH